MSDRIFNIENVSLDDIKINKASLENRMISNIHVDIKSLEISYGFEGAINTDHKLVKVTFWCNIESSNKEEGESVLNGHYNIDFLYKVQDLENWTHRSEGETFIQADALVPLANISYSTARGIIYNRCLGTLLDKFILPILPTHELYDFFPANTP
ncbi:hypothetical protein SAMN05518672_101875 [Chitinophaga sp. CF118]|uniref:hypothetical protein n=1 Tax=Chitinophaga sp. CF118 TaxID=1884367 RepID=UPI0008E12462|nr:hypothetical protein [Chitinophaga sp. CF118]SFD17413.1 hypothetical protein SAMN05518672_101875 [Chitinophaga sp. CF118]